MNDSLIQQYRETHPKSEKLHQRAARLFSAKGATHFVRVLDPFRPYITRAYGSKKWDADGHEYIDYVMGHGALLLGHGHPAIVRAVQAQAARGFHYGDNHELEVAWAELIQSMMPSAERVEFFSCGQEANLMAIRLSRAFTGRKKILRFAENFHGWADEVVFPPASAGTSNDEVAIVPYDLKKVEEKLATREYAILMTEGGGAHMTGQVPLETEFVRALPGLARKYRTVWHLDEVVTGFRDAVGGFQEIVGVKPDLTSLGKIVAGGLGAGALVGRADILDALDPGRPADRQVVHSGTWNGNPLTSAAAVAGLECCRSGEPQKRANALAAEFRRKANRMMREKGISAWLYGRSITHLYLGPLELEPSLETLPPTRDTAKMVGWNRQKLRLSLHLLQRGISTLQGRMFILSSAHTEEDVDKTVTALAASLEAMISEGSF